MIFNPQSRRNPIRLVGEKSSAFDLARGRLVLLSGIFVLMYMLLAARAIDLTVIQGPVSVGRNAAPEKIVSEKLVLPEHVTRGDIFDRQGTLLATTLKTPTLYVDPKRISDIKAVSRNLAALFPDLKEKEILHKMQSQKRFVLLRRDLNPQEQLAVLHLGEPGLDFKYEERRVYPQGSLMAHLVGYTNVDNQGLAGIERSYDDVLRSGQPLELTLDVRLQHALRREIKRAMKEFSAIGGAGLIMDVTNGEILAGVSMPDFDPQAAGETDPDRIFNRLTLGAYELGSVFKIFSTAAFLETHDVPMSTTFDASEPIRSGRFVINDYHAQDRILTIPEVFMHSSNIGSAMMGQAVGGEKLRAFYQDLGLLTPLKFDIAEIARPQVPNPWREVTTITAAYGHGLSTTPLQMVSAVATIVNGGTHITPTLMMKSVDEASGTHAPAGSRIISEKTSHRMRQLMRLVVTDGTGGKADVPGYSVGGKTGTAEKIKIGGYDNKRLISSFVGMFPSEAPRYVVFVMIDEPKGTKESFGYATAGWVAAPATGRVVASMSSILGLPPADIPREQDIASSLRQFVAVKHDD